MIRVDRMPVIHDKFKVTFDLLILLGVIGAITIGFAVFWQWVGANDERAFLLAERYEALKKCERKQAVAYIHVESGAVICATGSMRLGK